MRNIFAPVALLGLGVVVLILTLVAIAADSQNRLAIESAQHLAGSALRVEVEQSSSFARDYAFWNDAAEHLVVALDDSWADDNVGAWANDSLGMDGTLVVDANLGLVFGSLDGERQTQDMVKRLSAEFPILVSAALDGAGRAGDVAHVATSFLELDGVPTIATAAVVKWEDDRPIPLRGGVPVILVFLRRIDAEMLRSIEELFLLPGARLVAATELSADSVPLQSIDGRDVARLAWSGKRPGTKLILELAPSLAGILVLAVLLMALIVRRARRSTAELALSNEQLEAKTKALTASTVALRGALAEAAQANSAKSEFLARMSHELRTPLNAILGFSEIISMEMYGQHSDPRYRDYGRMIHESGDHLRSLINDILDLSRIEAGRFDLREEAIDLGSIIEQCVGLLAPKIEARGLRVEFPPCAIRLTADTRALKQILLNLMSNAVKFTDRGGLITVRSLDGPGGITIEVSDTGCGMSEEDLEHVFQLFGQARARVSRDGEGSGLGLNITKALVEMHGGTLELRSTLGVGTTAVVRFDPTRRLPPARIAESA